jgi:putative transposase
VIVDYISVHRDEFGVEPICRVLSEHGCTIAPSTFCDNLNRQPSKQKLRDTELVELIETERGNSRFGRLFGARKL